MQKNELKICFFGDASTQHIRRWSKYFANAGHQIQVITFNPDVIADYGPVRINIINKILSGQKTVSRFLNLIPMMLTIKRLIQKINPEIIHAHSAVAYSWLPAFLGFHPLIITPWGGDIFTHIHHSKIEKLLTQFALKKADLITCDGPRIKQAMIKLGIPGQKIKFIHFGTDIKKFKPNRQIKDFKNKLFFPGAQIITNTRIFEPIRDVATFIRAIPLIAKKMPRARFLAISYGPEEKSLKNLAQKIGANQLVKFTGRVSEIEMIRYLQATDIYVSTALSDSGLAASTAEAMACELPVVSTRTQDIRLWLKYQQKDFVIPFKQPQILAQKIIQLLKDDQTRKKLGQINRVIIIKHNNYDQEMGKMNEIYQLLARNQTIP